MDERVLGRRWTVRLDAAGRGSTAVRVSCSRPSCEEQRLPSAAAGRAAAIAHLKAHLKTLPEPRADVYCACRLDGCTPHIRSDDRPAPTERWRCGGAVVLAVVTDREGRWWRAMECCSRCAAAAPGVKVVATAPSAADPDTSRRLSADHSSAEAIVTLPSPQRPPATRTREVPAPRSASASRRPRQGKIAQRIIPVDLRPAFLRDELIELGDLFRAYQQRTEPDLTQLANLQERKARAFSTWADVTGDANLRLEAQRAEQAATTVRLQHQQRTSHSVVGDGPPIARLLTAPTQWEHARSVLAHVADHAPLTDPQARLVALMLTLRTALTGVGNVVGQDLIGLGLTDPENLVEQLADRGWLVLPGTASELLASKPENPTSITVPSLMPHLNEPDPFTFGKATRPKLSGWAQKVVSDKKLRKIKVAADARLLVLLLATQTSADGRLGPAGQGLGLERLASWCPVNFADLQVLVEQLLQAEWLAEAAVTGRRLTGRVTERILPLTCPLP
ncbi:hypothetical protein ACFWBC_37645 [Streptomyces sp. NPDC059985]|uniref:hypothetical protein n=1 Tax=Streptomyces sp. NPDC059985 TaxID=3347025 RepID=UPI0036A14D96